MKTCSKCKQQKSLEDFSPNAQSKDGRQPSCKKCCSDLAKLRYKRPEIKAKRQKYSKRPEVRAREIKARKTENYRTQAARRARDYRARDRAKAINLLGGRCACCPEDYIHFLEIHHKDEDGQKHRGKGGTAVVYRSVIAGTYPRDRLEVLCANCHTCITRFGVCLKHHPLVPHLAH